MIARPTITICRAAVALAPLLLCHTASRADVVAGVALPAQVPQGELIWGVKQNGRLLAEGHTQVSTTGEPAELILVREGDPLSTSLTDGEAVLYLCLNQDALHSYIPSVGDWHQQLTLTVDGGAARVNAPAGAWQQRRVSRPENLLTVHYHRFDGDYEAVGIWTWDEGLRRTPAQNEIFEVGRDDFGLIFQLDIADYGRPGDRIGLLPRMNGDWQYKDGGDRFWSPSMGNRVYLVEGRSEAYASPPDVTPQFLGATIDGLARITVQFTHALPPAAAKGAEVRDESGNAVPVAGIEPAGPVRNDRSRAYALRTQSPLDLAAHRYTVTIPPQPSREARLGHVLAGEPFIDSKTPLGANYASDATTFGVFAPTASHVDVLVADSPTGGQPTPHSMTRNAHGVWTMRIEADLAGKFYAYRLDGPGLDPVREVTDIYSTCAQGLNGRGMIVDLNATNPPGFDPSAHVQLDTPVDAIVYELHVRDLTSAANSGAQHKKKYLGLAESGTHLPNDPSVTTGLDHLAELGVTHVHLLPVQDFENDETADQFNWGYMTVFFNTPEGMYASTPAGHARIREFKQMVKALHDRGIGVVLDVVYNHTSPYASFEHLVPGYYHRMRGDGSFWNGSGCGNEFCTENPMARRFVIDSLAYWVREYGIDGFRFDLMGLMDLDTMTAIRDELRKINPSILLYGEPWRAGSSGIARVTDKAALRGTGIAAFNDNFRDAIKGDRDGGAPGFIQAGDRADRVRLGIDAAIHDWALEPTEVVTYCAAHDNLTLWDKIVQATPNASPAERERMQRFAGLIVLTSQGIPFLHAGQEICRTKGGNHNSYSAPDSVNQLDWSWKKDHRAVFDYYRGLITLRKAHPAFRLRTRAEIEARLRFLETVPSPRCLAFTIDARDLPDETFTTVLVLLNGHPSPRTFPLPTGQWRVHADADRAALDPPTTLEHEATLPPHSGMVLAIPR
ncbi:MAG: type I pullulanase [Phycisphaerae bacterium]|nr:type I pullulanase [Phycisphaerae bacterium]